jgi:hypothetical protein
VGKWHIKIPRNGFLRDQSTFFEVKIKDGSLFGTDKRVNLDWGITLNRAVHGLHIGGFGKAIGMGPGGTQ